MSEFRGEGRSLVLDTSVALKWYLTEERSEEAVRLLEAARGSRCELAAPGTIGPEFFNALWSQYRRGELDREEVGRIWGEFSSEQVASLYAPEDLTDRAADMVLETGVIIYDALFLALAEGIGTVVVTADDTLLRALEGTAYSHLARSLSEVDNLLPEQQQEEGE